MHFAYNFYVCGPASMKLIPLLVPEGREGVVAEWWPRACKSWELFPLVGFQNLKCIVLNNFYVCGPTSMKLIPLLVSEVRKV